MPTVTIRPGTSDEVVIPSTVGWERTMEIGKMRGARIHVDRSHLDGVTLNKKEDTVELEGIDTLLLVDVEKGGPTYTLVTYSHEWAANNVEPTTGGDLRQGTDKALIDALIGEVPSWTVGNTTSFTGGLSFVFSHAHRHEALRRIERNVPGEIQFRDSGTVDYVDSLGSDKSASVELSASAGTIENNINITERGRKLDGTHFRVLGAHEGEAQIYSNLVPSTDSSTYTNRVNYTTDRWSDGDTRDWDRWVNSDITDQATSDEEASALGEEISSELIEAKTTTNLSLSVGDWVQVVKPDADLDRRMRVHRIREISSSGTVTQELELSTRTVVREDANDTGRRLREFSTGFAGSAVWGTPSGGYQAVTSTDNYRLTFFYPDVEYEHTAELYVESQPYRTFHSGAASGGGTTATSASNAEFSNIEETGAGDVSGASWLSSVLDTPVELWSFTTTNGGSMTIVQGYYRFLDLSNTNVNFEVWVENKTTGDTFPVGRLDHNNMNKNNSMGITAVDASDTAGDEFGVFVRQTDTQSGDGRIQFTGMYQVIGKHDHTVTIPDHTHSVNPGVSNFPGTTASGVDVLVNGTQEATNIGSGSFETTVDISGTLNKGAFNTVELTSDSTGWLYATAGLESYRQIGKK